MTEIISMHSAHDENPFVGKIKEFFQTRSRMRVGIVLGILVGGAWLLWTMLFRPSFITAVGVGKLTVAPDKVSFIVTKVTQDTNPVSAIEAGDSAITGLIDEAKKVSNDSAIDIKKAFYQVSSAATGGYIVANAFSVETTSVTQIDQLIKSLYQAGASNVQNVIFTVDEKTTVEEEARTKAFDDAKSQAGKIAKSAGKHLGRLVSVQDDNTAPQSSTTTGSDINIVKGVSAVYEIW